MLLPGVFGLSCAYTLSFARIISAHSRDIETRDLFEPTPNGLKQFLELVPEGDARDVAGRLSSKEIKWLFWLVRFSSFWEDYLSV